MTKGSETIGQCKHGIAIAACIDCDPSRKAMTAPVLTLLDEMVEAMAKFECENELYRAECGHPHIRHKTACSKCEILAKAKAFKEGLGDG